MRKLTPDQLLLRLAGRLAHLAYDHLHLDLSGAIKASLGQAGVFHKQDGLLSMLPFEGSPATLLRSVVGEIERVSRQGRITLLIDGMEKVADPIVSADLFYALSTVPDTVELVVVVPWNITYRPHSESVIRPGESWVIVTPDVAEGADGSKTRAFLREIVSKRLGLDPLLLIPYASALRVVTQYLGQGVVGVEFAELLEEAARASGGLPRVYLQLVADAGTYSRLRRDGDWPNMEDLVDAESDMEDSFRRALQPGDTDAVSKAVGTDGRELELDRKVRLLARGILLERRKGTQVRMEIHPLARRVITGGLPNA
jgi:hypothetical protein